jgi:hypothetical protein
MLLSCQPTQMFLCSRGTGIFRLLAYTPWSPTPTLESGSDIMIDSTKDEMSIATFFRYGEFLPQHVANA